MMRRQLDDVHERGEPLAILWASEGSIYQRFGYGLATDARPASRRARPQRVPRAARASAATIRLVDEDEARAAFPPVYDAVRPTRPGFFTHTPAFWDAEVFHFPEHWRRGAASRSTSSTRSAARSTATRATRSARGTTQRGRRSST